MLYTAEQVREAAQVALDGWDFEATANGTGDKQKAVLMELARRGQEVETDWDLFDWLAEYAQSTAADMSEDWARRTLAGKAF